MNHLSFQYENHIRRYKNKNKIQKDNKKKSFIKTKKYLIKICIIYNKKIKYLKC